MTRATIGNTRTCLAALTVIAALAWMRPAFAQDPGQAPPAEGNLPADAQPAEPPPVPAEAPAPAPPPAVKQVAPPPETVSGAADSDLDPVNRPVGIGYAGVSQVPIGTTTAATITAPAIGARVWMSPNSGIDVALGFAWADGSTESGGVKMDLNAAWGFILQVGVPFALATHKHVSFQFIPAATFAYGETKGGAGPLGPSTSFSGTRFDLGARTGLEIFWGFIGLPQLSLSATVGAAFEVRKSSSDAGGTFGKASVTSYSITTTVQNNPWDIFTGNVAARYYF